MSHFRGVGFWETHELVNNRKNGSTEYKCSSINQCSELFYTV